jgi:hypothetical protein
MDVSLIARYYRNSGVKHFYTFDTRYLPLRFLSRAYSRLIHNLAAEKAGQSHLNSQVDCNQPEMLCSDRKNAVFRLLRPTGTIKSKLLGVDCHFQSDGTQVFDTPIVFSNLKK